MRIELLTPDWGAIVLGEDREALTSLDCDTITNLYRDRGVVLFRGFRVDPDTFREHTERFCHDFIVHPHPNREIVSADATTMGVTPGRELFFAHSELGYSPIRPDVAWFYCETPARSGGETTVYDGVEVLRGLSAATRALFSQKRLMFKHHIPSCIWERFRGGCDRESVLAHLRGVEGFTFAVDADGWMRATYLVSAILKTKHGRQLAFANSLLDQPVLMLEDGSSVAQATKFEILGVTESLAFPLRWRANDVAMIDNSRFMHGRTPFDDPERRVLARFGNARFA